MTNHPPAERALPAMADDPATRAALCMCSMIGNWHAGRIEDALRNGEACLSTLDEMDHRGRCGVLFLMGIAQFITGSVRMTQRLPPLAV